MKVILILGFVHVLEYLWKAAYCFHAPGTEQAERWVAERALQILQGNSSHVAAGMRRSATLRELLPKERQAVDECANYLLQAGRQVELRTWPMRLGTIPRALGYRAERTRYLPPAVSPRR